MGLSRSVVVAFGQNSALVNEHGTDDGIGKRKSRSLSGKVQGALHVHGIGSHCAKVHPYLCRVTWRELQQAFIQARSGFEPGEAGAHWRRWIEAQTGQSYARAALQFHEPASVDSVAEFRRTESDLRSTKPIQQILGFEYFDGLTFRIDSNVLIPRPETEELVAEAAQRAPVGVRVLDLGTGSGCIALALKRRRADLRVAGLDCSRLALAVAAENARRLALEVDWHWGDLCEDPPAGLRAEVVVSNPPYIAPEEELAPEVRDFEPSLALFAPSGDVLFYYRRILVWAEALGATQLGFECHRAHAAAVAKQATDAGWDAHGSLDQFGAPRWVWAQKSRP